MPNLLIIPGIEQINDEIERNRRQLRERAISRQMVIGPPLKALRIRKPEQDKLFEPLKQRRLI